MELIKIPLKKIHEDHFFRFSQGVPSRELSESIRLSGIRTPVQVISRDGSWQILSGFKRVAAARALGFSIIPAEAMDNSSLADLFINVIREQLAHRPVSLVEKARIVGIFQKLGMDSASIVKEVLPLIDIPNRRDIFQVLETVRGYSACVHTYLDRYSVSLKKAIMFRDLTVTLQEQLTGIAERFKIRPVELSEIILLLKEIAKRESVSPEQVLEQGSLNENSGDETPRNEAIDSMKKNLQARRYPNLALWQQKLEKARNGMNLPLFMRLHWDPNLEAPGIRIEALLQSLEDLKLLESSLEHERIRELFREMFGII